MRGPLERSEYLRRLEISLKSSNWTLLGYALMSTHLHLALVAGRHPFDTFIRRIHPAFARWLNRHQGRLGPVFADRPSTYILDEVKAPKLLAYLHNNPVKAGVSLTASDCSWTSHQAYTINRTAAPSWLNVELGLQLGRFEDTPTGRQDFDRFVNEHANEADDWLIDQNDEREHRREAREALGSALELACPHLKENGCQVSYPILTEEGIPLHSRWSGNLKDLLKLVSRETKIPIKQIQARDRSRKIVRARRLFMLLARVEMGRSLYESSCHVGITPAAGLKLIRSADPPTKRHATRIAENVTQKVNK